MAQCAPVTSLPARPFQLRRQRMQSARTFRTVTKTAMADPAKLDERVRTHTAT